ncbi:MAG TPA: LPS export ABC transporter periplasmic protein LptC [Oceanospirillaceae bacterium]|nr:LPS export ABC transporter periplasmic protein LptC [Oceanospirillaceae bacterium]
MSALIRSRWFYLNLVALAALVTSLWWWQQAEQQNTDSKESWIPDYYLTNATIQQFDTHGELSSSIYAQRFSHIREFDSTDMTQPRFNIYLGQGNTWFGRADDGLILDSGAQINLNGDVLVTNGPDLQRPLSLSTQSLRLLPASNYAESDTIVRLSTQHSHLTGTGMRLTLSDQRLQLLSQVTGSHLIEKQ